MSQDQSVTTRSEGHVVIYTTPSCMGCEMTKRTLNKHGVEYAVVDLSSRPDLVEQFKREGLLSAPVVQAPDGKRTSGFRPDVIKSLIRAGQSQSKQRAQASSAPPMTVTSSKRSAQQAQRTAGRSL